jgi:hypothetical protein
MVNQDLLKELGLTGTQMRRILQAAGVEPDRLRWTPETAALAEAILCQAAASKEARSCQSQTASTTSP